MKSLILDRRTIVRLCAPVAGVVALVVFVAGGCGRSTNPSNPSTCVVGQVPTNPECVNPPNLLTVTIKNGVYSPNPVNDLEPAETMAADPFLQGRL